jgi:ADP-dependent NAD(P)H-hydrate dehydratase / NAD(P)H-hydrate epimerase
MKILSAAQMREADAFTISNEPIASIDLMERAAAACAKRIAETTPESARYLVFCGKGNNGGDGLAIARLLHTNKRSAEVFVVEHSENASADFSINLRLLANETKVRVTHIRDKKELVIERGQETIIIDALLGTGLSKPVQGLLSDVIDHINLSGAPVIAIDVPSGLFCDEKPAHKSIIRAATTLTFQRPKFTFFFADFAPYVGEFEVLDIGLNEAYMESLPSDHFYLEEAEIRQLLRPRARFSHKGTYGHALLLAGSAGKAGAAVMAARACLRAGAGLLTVQQPAACVSVMQTAVPEAMVSIDEDPDRVTGFPKNTAFDAIGIGPGIGTANETAQVLKQLIQNAQTPMVLDADALNILAQNKTWLSFVPPLTVLTPHPKEFDRLAGAHSSDFERLRSCCDFAQKYKVLVVLKGARTAIVRPDRKVFFNSTGNAALAKGGSGDVLTGMILGLLAQDYAPEHAAMIGVFVHGRAADLYVEQKSEHSMLAGDIIELLPAAFRL